MIWPVRTSSCTTLTVHGWRRMSLSRSGGVRVSKQEQGSSTALEMDRGGARRGSHVGAANLQPPTRWARAARHLKAEGLISVMEPRLPTFIFALRPSSSSRAWARGPLNPPSRDQPCRPRSP